MKKFLILFVMLFIFICVSYAGVSDVLTNSVDSVYHDGKAVADTLYPDVKSAIVSIGKAIGVAAEHVYGVLVKKYFVIGVKEACILVGGIIIFFIGLWNWRKYTKNMQAITYAVIVPVVLMIIGICTVFSVDYDAMLMGIINPEYGAINYILEYTKGIIK